MSLELPANLQSTADMLRNSMMFHGSEKAPAMPVSLFEDLSSRFSTAPSVAAPVAKVSLFDRIQSFIATPSFGMAAAALVILTVALPSVLKTGADSDTTQFRGGTEAVVSATTSIVLIGASESDTTAIKASGNFESGSILTTDTATGSKVVVDFNTSTITSVNTMGETVHSADFPTEKDALSTAIATAISKL